MSSYEPVNNVLDFNVALKPSFAFPLDARGMFGSYEEALAAAATAEDAGSTNTTYYFGQTVTVYEDGVAKSYIIQPDSNGKGTLAEPLPIIVESTAAQLQPDIYQVYGEVDGLDITLVEKDDGRIHEYTFEFIPKEGFTGLTVTPEVKWVSTPVFPPGKTCQISVMRGVGILVYA